MSGTGAASATCYKGDTATCAHEYKIFEATNVFRASNGLPPLRFSANWSFVARAWSLAQATKGAHFGHDGWPEQRESLYATEFHKANRTNAENVAMTVGASGNGVSLEQTIVNMWIASAGHRKNMLGTGPVMGVGFAQGPSGYYATEIFGEE